MRYVLSGSLEQEQLLTFARGKLVLIDAGAGTLLGPGVGGLLGHLRAAGFDPQQVAVVYVTDMHPDPPERMKSSAAFSSGRSRRAPLAVSSKIFSQPASRRASNCKCAFWSRVDTRA